MKNVTIKQYNQLLDKIILILFKINKIIALNNQGMVKAT